MDTRSRYRDTSRGREESLRENPTLERLAARRMASTAAPEKA